MRAEIMDALIKWVGDATDLNTVEREGPRPIHRSRRHNAIALLHIITDVGIGIDEIAITDNLAPIPEPNLDVTLCGLREFTLSVQVESFSQKAGKQASDYLGLARTCIRLPSVKECLKAVGLSLIDILPFINLDYQADNNFISRANMDVRFNYTETKTDTPLHSIESVVISSSIRNCDGTLVPSPPNVANKEIP